MSSILFSAIAPHPPIIVPEVGGARLAEAEKTQKALEKVAKRIKKLNPETIIVITPHGEIGMGALHVYASHVFEGDFANFGAAKAKLSFKGDTELARKIVKTANSAGINSAEISESWLDHGVLVPMYYPAKAGVKSMLLPIAIAFMELSELFKFGKTLAKSINDLGRKTVIIASADMSHRLSPDAPGGLHPRGKEFDARLVEFIKSYNVAGILNFDPELAEVAGQDALWSIAIMLGALEGCRVEQEVLSYEAPFGVGYMVAAFEIK